MIYGNPRIVTVNDITDLIGIRTLILSQLWQPSSGDLSPGQIDTWKPPIPTVSSGLLLVGEQTRRSEGAMRTMWTFQGVNGDGKTVTFKDRSNSLDYSFEPGFAQVSIQRHPNFVNLVQTYGGFPDNDAQNVIWPQTYSAATSALNPAKSTYLNPMFGENDFFRMEGTYRFRYAALAIPADLYSNVGMIFTNGLPGQPPAILDKWNWLMAPPSYRRRGLIFEIIEQYWLSGPGGWPTPVYGAANLKNTSGFGATNLQGATLA